jgi:hypothetical protein
MYKRGDGLLLLIFLALGLYGGFIYLAHHPETPWLAEAQDWPLVGESVHRFRVHYGGPQLDRQKATATTDPVETTDGASGESPATMASTPRPRQAAVTEPIDLTGSQDIIQRIYGSDDDSGQKDAGFSTSTQPLTTARTPAPKLTSRTQPIQLSPAKPKINYLAIGRIWVLPGNPILAEPAADAAVEAHLAGMAYLPVLSQIGSYSEVVYRGELHWVDTSWKPSYPRRGARRGILRHRAEPVQNNAGFRLKQARKILGIDRPKVKIGAYTLYTDVDDTDLLELFDSAAVAAEEAYFARYGRLPSGNPNRAVVLFAKESDYRRYSESSKTPTGTHVGHAGRGIATMFVEKRSREAIARTLVHEIGHLLNNRALAYQLPPWLEEGIASDLGSVWVEDSRNIHEEPSGTRWRMQIQGSEEYFLMLGQLLKQGEMPALADILPLDRDAFYQTEGVGYAMGFAFVRYLLDAEDRRHADAFRAFLKRIAAGQSADLLKILGTEVPELERGFRAWVEAEVQSQRQSLEQRARG